MRKSEDFKEPSAYFTKYVENTKKLCERAQLLKMALYDEVNTMDLNEDGEDFEFFIDDLDDVLKEFDEESENKDSVEEICENVRRKQ